MVISEKKTKAMVINFTEKYQFQPRLKLNKNNIEVVEKMKILGTIISDKLSWGENCDVLVRKVNARMQLLRKVWSFGSTVEEMVDLWKTYCLSVLDQSCVLWGSMLTVENEQDLERTQKTFARLVLQENFTSYNEALEKLGLQNLKLRRKMLTLRFAKRSLADGHFKDLILKRKVNHRMKTRKRNFYEVTHANTDRFRNSPIITMQHLLNEDKRETPT